MTDKPAIPTAFPWTHGDMTCTGMTLRDYFAAKAMQALLAAGINSEQYEEDAIQAYAIADAMLKARDGD
jgi:hypothetical protein